MDEAPAGQHWSGKTSGRTPADAADVTAAAECRDLDEKLIQGCMEGNQSAYRRLYERHAEQVQRQLSVLLGPGGDVEDAMQQVFLTLFHKLGVYDPRRAKLSTWIFGITQRVALNARRGARRRNLALGSLTNIGLVRRRRPTGPDEQAARNERLRRLYGYLDTMSEKKRVAFLLHFVEGLDLQEVATRLGTTKATAWARIDRARTAVIALIERDHQTMATPMRGTP